MTVFNAVASKRLVYDYTKLAGIAVITGMTLDADTKKIAGKFYAKTTSAPNGVEFVVNVLSASQSVNFRIGLFADSSDAPGAQVGSYTADIACPAATGAQYLNGGAYKAISTGTLTLNNPYWWVIEYSSGTLGSGIQLCRNYGARADREKARHYNSSNWTTISAQNYPVAIAFTHASGDVTFVGPDFSTNASVSPGSSSAADIFLNSTTYNIQGVKYSLPVSHTLQGVEMFFTKTGSPSNLFVRVFSGLTQVASEELTAAELTSATPTVIAFTSPPTIAAGETVRIVLSQEGTSGSNDYDLRTYTIDADFNGGANAGVSFISMGVAQSGGAFPTTVDWSGETVITTELPMLNPVFWDATADLVAATGGSGGGPLVGGRLIL